MSTQRNKSKRVLVLLAPDLAVDFEPFGQRKSIFGEDEINKLKEANGTRVVDKQGKSHQDLVVMILDGTVSKATVVAGLKNKNLEDYVFIKDVSKQLERAIEIARNSKL